MRRPRTVLKADLYRRVGSAFWLLIGSGPCTYGFWPKPRCRHCAIAHDANNEGTILREATLASGYVSGADFDRIVNPAVMVGQGPRRLP